VSPALLLVLLLAAVLALIPVWRLHVASWRPGVLLTAWLCYAIAIVASLRFAAAFRFLLPILVLAFVAPFVVRPERLGRFFGPRPIPPRPVIDVTPRPAPGLPEPPEETATAEPTRTDGDIDRDEPPARRG
jgi:hypothetical protein